MTSEMEGIPVEEPLAGIASRRSIGLTTGPGLQEPPPGFYIAFPHASENL